MVKLIKIVNPHGTKVESLTEVYVNPEHVSYIVEDEQMPRLRIGLLDEAERAL